MAVNFDGQSIVGPTITGTTAGAPGDNALVTAGLVKATFDKLIKFKQRTEPYYRRFATVRPAELAYPGDTITYYTYDSDADLALATTPLDEYADPDFVALKGPKNKTLTLAEYGNATVTTMRLRDFAWSQIDPLQAYAVGRNMGDTVDKLVENVIMSSANKYTTDANGAVSSGLAVDGSGKFTAQTIRDIVTEMRSNLAMSFDGNQYVAFIHPRVAQSLRQDTDAAGWRPAHTNTENTNGVLFSGDVGVFEGVRFIETTRVPVRDAAGDDVYTTIILGQDALIEALNREFSTNVVPTSDKFGRLMGLGWYGCAGWGIYNEESISLVETGGEFIVPGA
jgi:N4-gp56 family major capsid protein